jgi:hypothetical protein
MRREKKAKQNERKEVKRKKQSKINEKQYIF